MTTNGEPEVESDFDEIKQEAARQDQADREAGAAQSEASIADIDYLPQEPGPAASAEDYDAFDVDPEDVDDK